MNNEGYRQIVEASGARPLLNSLAADILKVPYFKDVLAKLYPTEQLNSTRVNSYTNYLQSIYPRQHGTAAEAPSASAIARPIAIKLSSSNPTRDGVEQDELDIDSVDVSPSPYSNQGDQARHEAAPRGDLPYRCTASETFAEARESMEKQLESYGRYHAHDPKHAPAGFCPDCHGSHVEKYARMKAMDVFNTIMAKGTIPDHLGPEFLKEEREAREQNERARRSYDIWRLRLETAELDRLATDARRRFSQVAPTNAVSQQTFQQFGDQHVHFPWFNFASPAPQHQNSPFTGQHAAAPWVAQQVSSQSTTAEPFGDQHVPDIWSYVSQVVSEFESQKTAPITGQQVTAQSPLQHQSVVTNVAGPSNVLKHQGVAVPRRRQRVRKMKYKMAKQIKEKKKMVAILEALKQGDEQEEDVEIEVEDVEEDEDQEQDW